MAKLLIDAILAYEIGTFSSNLLSKLRVRREQTTQGDPVLRVKGDIALLRTLIEIYGQSSQLSTAEDQHLRSDFLHKSEQEQIDALKNALTCLDHRQLIEDQREKGTNNTIRHFLLRLRNGIDQPKENLEWLFGLDGQWEKNRSKHKQKREQTSNLTSAKIQIACSKLAQFLPQNLVNYTPNNLIKSEDLIPDFEALVLDLSSLSTTDQVLILENLIRFYLVIENHAKVESLLDQASQILASHSPEQRLAVSSHYHYLGVYRYQQKQLSQAKTFFEKALSLRQADAPSNDSQLASTLHNLASIELESGHLSKAEQYVIQAIVIYRQLPEAVLELASSLIVLGNIRSEQRRFPEAEIIYQKTLAEFHRILINNPLLAHLNTGLGHLYAKQGQYDRARSHYTEAITQLKLLYGEETPLLKLPQESLKALNGHKKNQHRDALANVPESLLIN